MPEQLVIWVYHGGYLGGIGSHALLEFIIIELKREERSFI